MISEPLLDVVAVGPISCLKFLLKETKVNFVYYSALLTFENAVCISVCKMPDIFSTFPQIILKIITQCIDIFNANG